MQMDILIKIALLSLLVFSALTLFLTCLNYLATFIFSTPPPQPALAMPMAALPPDEEEFEGTEVIDPEDPPDLGDITEKIDLSRLCFDAAG